MNDLKMKQNIKELKEQIQAFNRGKSKWRERKFEKERYEINKMN